MTVRSEEIPKAVARCLVMAGQHRRLVECRQIESANWRYRPSPAFGDFRFDWQVYLGSCRSQSPLRKSELGDTGHCRRVKQRRGPTAALKSTSGRYRFQRTHRPLRGCYKAPSYPARRASAVQPLRNPEQVRQGVTSALRVGIQSADLRGVVPRYCSIWVSCGCGGRVASPKPSPDPTIG